MRTLHYKATVGADARAVRDHVEEGLRPHQSYLGSIDRALKDRQSRARARWRPVEGLERRVLDPMDTVLAIHPTAALGHTAQDEVDALPGELRDRSGRTLARRGPALRELEGAWRICIEGRVDPSAVLVDGREGLVAAIGEPPRFVRDAAGQRLEVVHGELTTQLDAGCVLHGEDGCRYRVQLETSGSNGWVELLPADAEADLDETADPRALFCESDPDEVWTSPRKRDGEVLEVLRIDEARWRLRLKALPAPGTTLYLPRDSGRFQQTRVIQQLCEAPLPHQRSLLRLCEPTTHAAWPSFVPARVERWYELEDADRDGTLEQRAFVATALATPDFAFLEGPPGSGKTTAICELILQLVGRGLRVLLCSTTHVALDNVLERLVDRPEIDAIRVGDEKKVDRRLSRHRLEARAEELEARWRAEGQVAALGTAAREAGAVRRAARRLIAHAANLTCGTTTGIARHPFFGEEREGGRGEPSKGACWDVLIIDEASKTTLPEALVPAAMCRRWVIVGDVRQLPPFSEREQLALSLGELRDRKGGLALPAHKRRALLLLFRLDVPRTRQEGLQWLIIEDCRVLDALVEEIRATPIANTRVVRVVARASRTDASAQVREVGLVQLTEDPRSRLEVMGADWVLVADDLAVQAGPYLPPRALHVSRGSMRRDTPRELLHRHELALSRSSPLKSPYRDRALRRRAQSDRDVEELESTWLAEHEHTSELAWRLARRHELRGSRRSEQRSLLARELVDLLPAENNVHEAIAELAEVGLPSILEVLQTGVDEPSPRRIGALSLGLAHGRARALEGRLQRLSFQHRMHPDIAAFPRDEIYAGEALYQANTIAMRDEALGVRFDRYPRRSVWLDVRGDDSDGSNPAEVATIEAELRALMSWASANGPPRRRNSKRWEIACLTFYTRQERALADMVRRVTRTEGPHRFAPPVAPVDIACATVDRFQGREADFVLLSFRNRARIGFLDSPNRLNVALTRARQLLVLVGNAAYFRGCRVPELSRLVSRCELLPGHAARQQPGGAQ